MPQPPIDGTWVRFFGRRTGDAGIVARWVKTGTLYEGYGKRFQAPDWQRSILTVGSQRRYRRSSVQDQEALSHKISEKLGTRDPHGTAERQTNICNS
jgi:hypothetical protein